MIDYNLNKIRSIVFDIDGVLSQNSIQINELGVPIRTANIKDGYAIQLAVKLGIHVAIITGAKVESIRVRYENLGVKDIFLSCERKIEVYENFKKKYNLSDDEIVYVGDDIPDFEIMQKAGCPCCPADACKEIMEISKYISTSNGGCGVGRDIIEKVLKAQGKWVLNATAFGW